MKARTRILALAALFFCLEASGQTSAFRIFFERIFGPGVATVERREKERMDALPGIASADTVRDGSLSKYVWEPYARVHAIDTPENPDDRIETDVRFLSDEFCAGRAMGTPGYSAAAFYVADRFRECGLDVHTESFTFRGVPGHNVIGTHTVRGATKWIIVLSRLDGVGDYSGKRFPAADANASGVAAMLALADRMRSAVVAKNVMYVALDGHHQALCGADALWGELQKRGIGSRQIAMVVNIEEIGTDLVPPVKEHKNYLIALGGADYGQAMWDCNGGLNLQLHFDYYGSENFTRMFYRRVSDHRVFLENACPCVMFTSGITMNTNRLSDTPATLNYDLIGKRVEFMFRWIRKL